MSALYAVSTGRKRSGWVNSTLGRDVSAHTPGRPCHGLCLSGENAEHGRSKSQSLLYLGGQGRFARSGGNCRACLSILAGKGVSELLAEKCFAQSRARGAVRKCGDPGFIHREGGTGNRQRCLYKVSPHFRGRSGTLTNKAFQQAL